MKSFKYIALSSMALVMGLTSCSDFLDKLPDERTEIDSPKKIVDLLKTSYPSASFQWISELSSDNLIDNNCPHVPYDPDAAQKNTHYNLSTYSGNRMDEELYKFEPAVSATYNTQDSPGNVWNSYYSSVASVNHALEAIDRIGGTDNAALSNELKAAKGEALLIRAYDHFILLNVYSQAYKDEQTSKNDVGVPYVTEVENVVNKHYERGNVADTYAKIKKDLEEGLSLISDVNYEKPKWHFNVNAAHAFAARVYLYTHEWDKVIEHADAVLGTDINNVGRMLMDYSGFGDCSTSSDFANVWQDPAANNNLMLISTYSLLSRRASGYRFSTNSLPLRDIYYHVGPTWSGWKANPTGIVGGFSFYRGDSEYGYFPAKIIEQFQYTNKVSGIGYVHGIMRAFTGSLLILERAEAKIMKADYTGAMEDIIAYDKSRQTFSPADKQQFRMTEPTADILMKWYSKSSNPNCFANWDFTQIVSAGYVIPAEAVPYMNAINDMRRFETWMEGLRFFDLKRWGIEYTHELGLNSTKYVMKPNDMRMAIELPWEALSAGIESSRPQSTYENDVKDGTDLEKFKVKE